MEDGGVTGGETGVGFHSLAKSFSTSGNEFLVTGRNSPESFSSTTEFSTGG